MRQKISLTLIVLLGLGAPAYAQDKGLRGVYGVGESAIPGAPGIGQSARPASGVYGAGVSSSQSTGAGGLGSAAPLRPLSGVYGPGESASPIPPASTASGNGATAQGNGPNVSINGFANVGTVLPFGTNSTPLDDRPGYGVATVNGRRAIIDRSTNRIYEYQE
jgi:hypothetical protein